MAKAIGIDLGTTNTVAAEARADRVGPTTIVTRDTGKFTRSVVGYDGHAWLAGEQAEGFGRIEPAAVISSTKRFIGINYGDQRIAADTDRLNADRARPRVIAPPAGEAGVRFRFYPSSGAHVDTTPIGAAETILRQVREDAEAQFGTAVTHAVITVPAYFDAARIEATRQAGEAAGLVVQRVISEPLAAALAYGSRLDSSTTETVMVYDLGGGTFDVTISVIGKEACIELAKDGSNHLGGDDFDGRLEQLVIEKVRAASGMDLGSLEDVPNEKAQLIRYELRRECHRKKEMLSSFGKVTILESAWRDHPSASAPSMRSVEITRAEFEGCVRDLVEETLRLAQSALTAANCKPADIDKVLLVGGSTFLPCVRERVRALFGHEKVQVDVDPMEAVAHGAALLALTLPRLMLCPTCHAEHVAGDAQCQHCGTSLHGGHQADTPAHGGQRTQLFSTIARSIGVETAEGNLVTLFKRGSPYSPTDDATGAPTEHVFRVATTGARAIRLAFYEGEALRSGDPANSFYAEYTVVELPADLRQGEEVRLSARLNGDGTLTGRISVRAQPYSYIASPGRWRGDLLTAIEEAQSALPNIRDAAARAQLDQAIGHAEDIGGDRNADGHAGRQALTTLNNALAEAVESEEDERVPAELRSLRSSLAFAHLMLELGGEWVNALPMVAEPALRDRLLAESQLLSALRIAVIDGRQIAARHDTSSAARATERIDALVKTSDLLQPLVLAQVIADMPGDSARRPGPGGLLSHEEWVHAQRGQSRSPAGYVAERAETPRRTAAQQIAALLPQMRRTIVTSAGVFYAQLARVYDLTDHYFAASE